MRVCILLNQLQKNMEIKGKTYSEILCVRFIQLKYHYINTPILLKNIQLFLQI